MDRLKAFLKRLFLRLAEWHAHARTRGMRRDMQRHGVEVEVRRAVLKGEAPTRRCRHWHILTCLEPDASKPRIYCAHCDTRLFLLDEPIPDAPAAPDTLRRFADRFCGMPWPDTTPYRGYQPTGGLNISLWTDRS